MPKPIKVTYIEAHCILSERLKVEVDKLSACTVEKWAHKVYSSDWMDARLAEIDQEQTVERVEKALKCIEGLIEARPPMTFFVPGLDHLLLAVE